MSDVFPNYSNNIESLSKTMKVFLSELKSKTQDYKRDLKKRLVNSNSELFRKKEFDDCVSLIENNAFDEKVSLIK